jgi:uncharacterized protein (TIGR00730 family)
MNDPTLRICVFCGSRSGTDPAYVHAATAVGTSLARRGIGVVYGGGRVGCMGAVADAALAAGGEVIGIIPEALVAREVAHPGLTALHVVSTMHERKALMADLSNAFLTLPGGFGTLEELFEVVTWRQLGIHAKPIALLDVAGYFDPLLDFCDRSVTSDFVNAKDRANLISGTDIEILIDRLLATIA